MKSNQLLAAAYSFVNHETSQTTRFEGDRQVAPYLTVLLTSISINHNQSQLYNLLRRVL